MSDDTHLAPMGPLIGGWPSDAYSPMTPDEAVQSFEPLAPLDER